LKKFYTFYFPSSVSVEEGWAFLEGAGVELAYGAEDEEWTQLYGYLEEEKSKPAAPFLSRIEEAELPPIDWYAQWEAHGLNFHEGYVHVDLTPFGYSTVIRLLPGPGFGDLSHPTTRLTLELMAKEMKGQSVVDIGCGSGVLTLSAAAMGASFAYGIDIDQEALVHAAQNAVLNQLQDKTAFYLPPQFHSVALLQPLIVLNMIASEQEVAWASLPVLHSLSGSIITSGIRSDQQESYLMQTAKRGWHLIETKTEEEWMAFIFKMAPKIPLEK
jgi:ribosomal protein L11 methyltransferase